MSLEDNAGGPCNRCVEGLSELWCDEAGEEVGYRVASASLRMLCCDFNKIACFNSVANY